MGMVHGLLRFILGQLFILASFDKILHPAAFAQAVANYQILPGALVAPVAVVLPWVELICGLALVLKLAVRGAALVLLVLMSVFLAALAYNLYRGLDIACGCFSSDPIGEPHVLLSLVRDIALWLMAVVVMATASDKRQTN